MSSYRLVASNGSKAIVGGSKGIAIVDPRTGEIIARNDAVRATDVAITDDNGTPYALTVTPGNPATVALDEFTADLGSYVRRESPNPPYGGRIATTGDELYWQAGGVVRRYEGAMPGRTIDTGTNAYDCATTPHGFAIVAGREVQAWNDDGEVDWAATLPAAGRYLVGGGGYLVAWGGAVRESGGIMVPMTIIDAVNGDVVDTLEFRGRNLPACAAIDGDWLLVGRPDYRDGEAPRGVVEVYDLDSSDRASTIVVDKPPLAIAATDYGAIYVSGTVHVLSSAQLYPDAAEPEPVDVDPLAAWLATAADADPRKVALVEMIAPLLGFTTPAQYAGLYAIVP